MSLPIWMPDALRSERRPIDAVYWRCVEAQHVVSTMRLVDTLDEQAVLEDILEDSKPTVPPDCAHLHYLYHTPFRYGAYPHGSRFRRAGHTDGVLYVAKQPITAVIETAFHLLLFYADSPQTPFPRQPSEHSVFDVPVRSDAAIDLMQQPFTGAAALWTDAVNYGACQDLADTARREGIDFLIYPSVRDPRQRPNGAVLACQAIAAKAPSVQHSWRIVFNGSGVHVFGQNADQHFSLNTHTFDADPRLADFSWSRPFTA